MANEWKNLVLFPSCNYIVLLPFFKNVVRSRKKYLHTLVVATLCFFKVFHMYLYSSHRTYINYANRGSKVVRMD